MEDHSPFGVDIQCSGVSELYASIVVHVGEVWIVQVFNHFVVRIGMTKEIPIAHHECTGDD